MNDTTELRWERDVQADAAYARLFDAEIVRTIPAGDNVNFDVDWTGRPVGIEVLGSTDWVGQLVQLFMRGEVRLVHGFDDDVPAAAAGSGTTGGDRADPRHHPDPDSAARCRRLADARPERTPR